MTQQFDEGVKEIVLSLLSLAATSYEANYLAKYLSQINDTPEHKVAAVQQAETIINSPKFDQAAERVLVKLKQPTTTAKISDSDLYDMAAKFVMANEIIGTDIRAKVNDRFLTVHPDDAGIDTIGIGHKLMPGDPKVLNHAQVEALFKKDLAKHFNIVKGMFRAQWDKLPTNLKIALIDISYRGDLVPQKGGEFNFIKLIKQGKYATAAKQYLDHTEYIKRKHKDKSNGVVKRMDKNAKIIAMQS